MFSPCTCILAITKCLLESCVCVAQLSTQEKKVKLFFSI